MKRTEAKNIDEYIADFPGDIQKILQAIRSTVSKAAPGAKEAMKYAIPTFTLNGNLVHFAAFKNHVGFYPSPKGIQAFKKETARFEGGKGTLQFPLDKPMPLALISRIVKYRVKQDQEKAKAKTRKTK